jgi:hypothetical protein
MEVDVNVMETLPQDVAGSIAPRSQVLTISDEVLHSSRGIPVHARGTHLPFTVRLVRTEEHLLKAVQVRAQAFLRHAPQFGAQLLEPEEADRTRGNVVLLAESKSTGEPEGSIRIETNLNFRTELEAVVRLPDFLRDKTIAQVGRLGVKAGPDGTLVKRALFKALYRFCLATQIDYMLVAARTPVDREFMKLGFREVFEQPTLLSFPSQGKKHLRLFVFDVPAGERTWREAKHPLYKFMIEDFHPDIEIFSSVRGMWAMPRSKRSSESRVPDVPATLDIPVV